MDVTGKWGDFSKGLDCMISRDSFQPLRFSDPVILWLSYQSARNTSLFGWNRVGGVSEGVENDLMDSNDGAVIYPTEKWCKHC